MNQDILSEYKFALELLDAYDHQCIEEIDGVPSTGKLKYDECIELISEMNFSSSVFGKEKEEGKLKGELKDIVSKLKFDDNLVIAKFKFK